MRHSNWLCLDCSKDTFDEYYGVRNHLWRRAVDRSQRHGMLCLSCLEQRLGRPLVLEDFTVPNSEQVAKLLARKPALDVSTLSGARARQSDQAFDDSPMDWDDYGIYDDLSPDTIGRIDAAIESEATARPRKVATIIGRVVDDSPAHVPGRHDYFYLERLCLLVESGDLVSEGDFDNPMRRKVRLA